MQLFKHQQDALKRTEGFNKVAYYHDMGLGKTFTGSEKMELMNTDINLIVCQKSKINDWIEHLCKYYAFNTFNLSDSKGYENFIQGIKSKSNDVVGVINYDLIFRRPELLKLEDFTLMLDESSMIQNSTAKRTKYVLKLKAKNVILLSGTPVGGKYENLFSQIKLLGWEITKKDYWKRYIDFELVQYGKWSPKIPKVIGYKNIDELKQNLRLHGADFVKTDDVFELPTQNFNQIYVSISKEYKIFKKDKYVEINDVELVGDNPLKAMLYARMLCGAYNRDKLNAFCDLIESTDDRLIVFYNFQTELEVLLSVIGKRAYSVVNGDGRNLENYQLHDNSITFIQYQAGAMGLNLQKANKIIYFTLPLSSELFEQSKKRVHRIGQSKPCFYYFMLCQNSLETKILETLEKRNDFTQKLFEEDFKNEIL